MFSIGPWVIDTPSILAPMAGITDLPFRRLCQSLGAGLAVSEMLTADQGLWQSRKSRLRLAHTENQMPRSVQLAGNDPQMMARAAASLAINADIIDINMGCPAKKVCKKAAGSALLRNEKLVASILTAVVKAVDIPVTLKIRTGWDKSQRNAINIARMAEDIGIQALAVHGRTRACGFKGEAEYNTIAEIVNAVDIPVFANGDITTSQHAYCVLKYTNANAVMIGRGAQGNPWLFREINHYIATGKTLAAPTLDEVTNTVMNHIETLHKFYGGTAGTRIARKHFGWYLNRQVNLVQKQHIYNQNDSIAPNIQLSDTSLELTVTAPRKRPEQCSAPKTAMRQAFNRIESAQKQCRFLQSYFETLKMTEEKAA